MLRYFIKRLLGMIPTLIIVAVCVFFFIHLLPGDPARLAAGPEADEATVEMIRHSLGLDRSIPEQFVNFVVGACQGDFGTSIRSQRPVIQEIGERFGPTLWLTLTSMVWSVIFGLVIGVISAVYRNKWPDRIGMTLAVSGISFPSITLGAAVAAVMARFTRASFVEVLHDDYIRTARAKGVTETKIVAKHALRNALIPVVTMMGLQFGFLLGGSIVVEKVFNWPGMGRLLVDAVDMRDYPVIQASVLLFSLEFIVINLVVDVLYGWINPSIRYK
ncbi:MAG: glutathione ABC transporter permease GsiC [Sutterella sp. 54_7]|nr:MAG: glutathione ABC transporter permease GsiC [Sutterella sp. 54_7]